MPVALYTTFWLARYGGISCRELMYDYEKTAAIAERAVLEFEPDAVAPLFIGNALGPTLEAFGYKQLRWAGHGVGDDQPYQCIDAEYMTAAEYPELLKDPTGFDLCNTCRGSLARPKGWKGSCCCPGCSISGP